MSSFQEIKSRLKLDPFINGERQKATGSDSYNRF